MAAKSRLSILMLFSNSDLVLPSVFCFVLPMLSRPHPPGKGQEMSPRGFWLLADLTETLSIQAQHLLLEARQSRHSP